MGVRRHSRTVAFIGLLGLYAHSARAQPEPARLQAELRTLGQTIATRYDVTVAFTEDFRRRLRGGLTSRILIETLLVGPGNDVLSARVRTCELRLDVWDDLVYARISDSTRVGRHTFRLIDDALRACGQVDIAIADPAMMTKSTGYIVQSTVSLNPVSEALLERTREFTANPRGDAGGRPRAFFGAVSRLFRAESDIRGTVFIFRSQRLRNPRGRR
jgi:hypothetical protein